jgi:hypothetical protein
VAVLNSASTIEQIHAEFANTASYREDGDVGKARRFITACTLLLNRTPRRHGPSQSITENSPELILKLREEAQAWLEQVGGDTPVTSGTAADDVRPRLTHADLRNFRGCS